MKISIHQPMYIPWVPYFFKLIHSDVFVFFDDVQYPRSKNFNNRNYIKSLNGPVLLTIPIKKRSDFNFFAFHISNPFIKKIRNVFLKRLVKSKSFIINYLGEVYKN